MSLGDCSACVALSKHRSPFLAGAVDAELQILSESRASAQTVVLVK